jgi:hypothetical protein
MHSDDDQPEAAVRRQALFFAAAGQFRDAAAIETILHMATPGAALTVTDVFNETLRMRLDDICARTQSVCDALTSAVLSTRPRHRSKRRFSTPRSHRSRL